MKYYLKPLALRNFSVLTGAFAVYELILITAVARGDFLLRPLWLNALSGLTSYGRDVYRFSLRRDIGNLLSILVGISGCPIPLSSGI
jgi:hypothetical protein